MQSVTTAYHRHRTLAGWPMSCVVFGWSCKCYFREYLWPFADDIEIDIVEKTGVEVTADSVLPHVQRQALSVSHSLPLDMLNFDLCVAFRTLESVPAISWTLVISTITD